MEEFIVINKKKVVAFRPKGLDIYSQEYVEGIDIIENAKEVKQAPETFGELLMLLRKEADKMNVVWLGERGVDNKGEEFWFEGVLFKSNGTLSIRDKDESIRVIMCISYQLMWQIIESDLNRYRKEIEANK